MDTLSTTEKTAQKTTDTLTAAASTATSTASDAMRRTQDTIKDSAEHGLAAGQDALQRTQAETQRLTQRSVEMGSEAIKACVSAGHQTADLLSEINQAMTELGNQSIARYDTLSRQALSVRTVQDAVNLQTAAVQGMQEHMGAFARVYSLYVDGLGKIMQPITEQAVKSQRGMVPA
ncbi:phasin family protein [Asticcacaulis sp. AND118]|uniref:phasin family protein n=1 Tax=Asticcacaulis sp. AND118 TaxID=2840468 RepID=UPI001CFFBBD3|nr:phasin family protein [Asticcacaulis sp. AND118]UDF05174.1 phasin family protein [Asticcacaulis sp. AND118]